MTTLTIHEAKIQQGFALIAVLIVLIVMTISGMALFRNIDTASLIAGNAAAKQAATQAGNVGLVVAQKVLSGTIPTTDGPGYSTKALASDSYGIPAVAGNATWSSATDANSTSASGYKYQYIIEKLCNAAGVCTTSSLTDTSNKNIEAGDGTPSGTTVTVNLYRVTVKVTGPRNTESYVQALYAM